MEEAEAGVKYRIDYRASNTEPIEHDEATSKEAAVGKARNRCARGVENEARAAVVIVTPGKEKHVGEWRNEGGVPVWSVPEAKPEETEPDPPAPVRPKRRGTRGKRP